MSGGGGFEAGGGAAVRESRDGSRIYTCTVCRRLEVSTYDGWLWHLGSREHQSALLQLKATGRWKRQDIRIRCITVHGIKGLKAREVLEYLGSWGEIEDFSYAFVNGGVEGAVNHCLCLYRDKESAEACVQQAVHDLKGNTLRVIMKRDKSVMPPKQHDGQGEERWKRKLNYEGFGSGWESKKKRGDE